MTFENTSYQSINFGPYVMILSLPQHITTTLHTEGLKKLESFNHGLAGHLNHQYQYDESSKNWFYQELSPVFNKFREQHNLFHNFKNLPSVKLEANNLWINFMQAGDYNPVHIHDGDISFVVFVDVPKELEEERNNFAGQPGNEPGSLYFQYAFTPGIGSGSYTHHPKTGDMIIFPAKLQHWVSPFKSKVQRISVSGNLTITNKDELPHEVF